MKLPGRTVRFSATGVFGVLVGVSMLGAGDEQPYLYWGKQQLLDLDKKMRATMDTTKGSHENMMKGRSYFMEFYRETPGTSAEVHRVEGDFGYVRSGEGGILTGGEFVQEKEPSPTEVRGTMKDGTVHKLLPGDVFYVPANMPHRVMVEPGKYFQVEMIKVRQKEGLADVPNFMCWTSADLAGKVDALKAKLNKNRSAVDKILIAESYESMLNKKEGTGPPETHVHLAEFQFVLGGEGSMVLGGELKGAYATAPGEFLGDTIEGGKVQQERPGDMLYIPANMPHQTQVENGKHLDKLILKVWDR